MIFPTSLTNKLLQSSTLTRDENVVLVMLGDGKSTRAGIGKQSFYDIWECDFVLNPTDYNTFVTFYRQHGLVKAFTWTNPLGDSGSYIFKSAPKIQFDGYANYSISFQLREVKESVL